MTLLESLKYHPLLTDPSCSRNDELEINGCPAQSLSVCTFTDCGHVPISNTHFALGTPFKYRAVRFMELLSNQVMMRIAGRLAQLDD